MVTRGWAKMKVIGEGAKVVIWFKGVGGGHRRGTKIRVIREGGEDKAVARGHEAPIDLK